MISEKQIEKAVNWWASRLPNPTFNTEEPEQDKMLAMFAAMREEDDKPTPEQIETFKAALEGFLTERQWYQDLKVDYNPDPTLKAALDAAGIYDDGMRLPYKTTMRFAEHGDGVKVSEGYGDFVEI